MGLRMGYIKLPVDFFEDERVSEIQNTQNGDFVLSLYIRLMCKSKDRSSKKLYISNMIPFTEQFLAFLVNKPISDVKSAISILTHYGFLKTDSDGGLIIFPFFCDSRNSREYHVWRKLVLERDGYSCRVCDSKRKTLHAHHVEKWSDCITKRFVVENGVALCGDCHRMVHSVRCLNSILFLSGGSK